MSVNICRIPSVQSLCCYSRVALFEGIRGVLLFDLPYKASLLNGGLCCTELSYWYLVQVHTEAAQRYDNDSGIFGYRLFLYLVVG